MNGIPLDKIVHEMTLGYSYNVIVRDESGKAIDYIALDVNQTYANMLGLEPCDIVNRRITEIVTDIGADDFDWIDFFGRIAATGERAEFEEYSKPLDRWFHISVMSPEPEHFVAFSFDITDKRKAELNLIISEERNRSYIDNAPDGIFISDEKERYVQINPAAADMLGYTRNELLGKSIQDITTTAPKNAIDNFFTTLNEKRHISKTVKLTKKNSELVTVQLEAVALPEGQNMAFCKDITAQELLTQEKDRYYTAFQAMEQPIIITDPKGVILAVNDAFTNMYGYTKEEAVGMAPHILNPGKDIYYKLGYASEDYDAIFNGLWNRIRDPNNRIWEGVIINRKKNGSLVWVNLVVNAIYDERGKIASIVGLPFDITSSREIEDRTRIQLYHTIAELAELRDDDTGNHMKRVGIFARLVAKERGMNEKFCADIELFSPMHDIGKVGILDSILRSPGKLTPEEFEIMKTHTVLGHNIMKGKSGFEMAADVTLYHHERFDGTGYPHGLSGADIPLSARITALADVYDALRSKRSYKPAWTHAAVVDYMKEHAGTQFDPDVIAAFITLNDRFEKVYAELMD
jgi:PAS domain S-box-containing protein